MLRHLLISGCCSAILLVAWDVSALQISEIMYNPAGTDTKREWVEIYNDGDVAVDLADYGLLENQVNHGINLYEGDEMLSPGDYAVIAGDAQTFTREYPGNFSVFDSVFSFNNTGEQIVLVDPDSNPIDSLDYLAEWGADGDGNTLNLISGSWVARKPSPGKVVDSGKFEVDDIVSTSAKKENVLLPHQRSTGSNDIEIIIPEVLVAGQSGMMKATYKNSSRVNWSFSDGESLQGQEVSRTFAIPGNYSVSVVIHNRGDEIYSKRHKIKVEPVSLGLSTAVYQGGRYLRITNNNQAEFDVSGWVINDGGVEYQLPSDLRLGIGDDYAFFLDANELQYPIVVTDSNNQVVMQVSAPAPRAAVEVQSPVLGGSAIISVSGTAEEQSVAVTDEEEIAKQERLAAEFASYSQPADTTDLTAISSPSVPATSQLAAVGSSNRTQNNFSPVRAIMNTLMVLLLGVGITLFVGSKKYAFAEHQAQSNGGELQDGDDYEIIEVDDEDF